MASSPKHASWTREWERKVSPYFVLCNPFSPFSFVPFLSRLYVRAQTATVGFKPRSTVCCAKTSQDSVQISLCNNLIMLSLVGAFWKQKDNLGYNPVRKSHEFLCASERLLHAKEKNIMNKLSKAALWQLNGSPPSMNGTDFRELNYKLCVATCISCF